MKCNRLIICFGLLLSVFFSLSLSSDTFAKQDISVTYDSSSSFSANGSQIFGSSIPDFQTFASYSYLKITFSPVRSNTSTGSRLASPLFYFRMNCTNGFGVFPYYSDIFYPISDYNSCNFTGVPSFTSGVTWTDLLSSGESVTFTLTDILPGASAPSGTLDITQNGQYDVSGYASANVNVPQSSVTPYDNKLDAIVQAIYVCAGTMLVIYFFYCIYRMIIKGVKV